MEISRTPLEGLCVIETQCMRDSRGGFSRLFCNKALAPALANRTIVQINHSITTSKGVIRGLHFQYPPVAEMKLVRCWKGRVFDVAVDLRKDSPTFLSWHAVELSPESQKIFLIPEGFAHGFQVLEEGSELLYLHTAPYSPEHEGAVLYNDPAIGIDWPLPAQNLSERDKCHALIGSDFKGIGV